MELFVKKESIVRKIWGNSDTVLFIFAGASAEFALNKAVDWLYFTGRLPSDPLGRMFSTLSYARQIVFSPAEIANRAIDNIASIHASIENSRRYKIPEWAYRDVLFMLIHYSQASFELLERKMTDEEKEDLFDVFYRVGTRMGIKGLPGNYTKWKIMHQEHLVADLDNNDYTADLYRQYKKHLGRTRYWLLKESQKMVVPEHVNRLLHLGRFYWLKPVLFAYLIFRKIRLGWFLKSLVLPREYRNQVRELDIAPT